MHVFSFTGVMGGGGGVVTSFSPVCAHGFFADKAHSKLITIFAFPSPLFFSSSLSLFKLLLITLDPRRITDD